MTSNSILLRALTVESHRVIKGNRSSRPSALAEQLFCAAVILLVAAAVLLLGAGK